MQDTDWLLLDEPVSSLDLRHQIEVLDMARRAAETRNLGVLLSLHDVNLAIRFAHTIALLAPSPQGARLEAHGDPAAVLTPGRMRAVYGIAMQAYHGEDGQVPLWFPSSTQS